MEIKRWRRVALALAAVLTCAAAQDFPPDSPDAPELGGLLLMRIPRATVDRPAGVGAGSAGAGKSEADNCRYARASWSECDLATNMRTRTLTLKKGDPATCERTKTIQKKCKKACRYEKAAWGACTATGEQTRADVLRAGSDSTCEARRMVTRKCARPAHQKPAKDKGRRNRQHKV